MALVNPPATIHTPVPRSLPPMPVKVAMDRAPFPPLRAQSEENEQLEELASLLIDEYVHQYERFQLQTYGLIRADWSPLSQRGGLDIYQQRKPASSDTASASSSSSMSSSAAAEAALPRLMATGTIHASLDDLMFASLAPTSEAMHVKMAATRSDDIDGLVLHTVTPVMAHEPFRFCGVKWLLRRPPPGLKTIVRQRDFVFLEATGVRVRADGERIGYHLCHSIEFAATPQLSRRGIVRGKMATCHLFRELAQAKVDVWASATLDMQGKMWRRVAIAEGSAAFAAIRDLPALAVTKKFMWFQENRPPQLSSGGSSDRNYAKSKSTNKCCNCGKNPRWPWKKRRRCDACGFAVCSTCSDAITVFPSGLDPRTNRETLWCCVVCVLSLSDQNEAAYASQSRLDPSQRGSAQSTGALCEDIRPKYDKAPPKYLPQKKNKALRARTCSGESGTTLTSSVVSRQSGVALPDHLALAARAESIRRRSLTRFNLADALLQLQAVADATYATQQQSGERFALGAAVVERQHARATEPRRRRAASTPSPERMLK